MKKTKPFFEQPSILLLLLIIPIVGLIFLRQAITRTSVPQQTIITTPEPAISIEPAPPFVGVAKKLTGEVVCLPHKNNDGPQTLECSYGLKDSKGKYYGLRDADPEMKNLSALPMNEEIEIQGSFKEEENDIYPIVGVIQIESFTRETK